MNRRLLMVAGLAMLASVPAFAGVASTNLSVSASINNNCTIATGALVLSAIALARD